MADGSGGGENIQLPRGEIASAVLNGAACGAFAETVEVGLVNNLPDSAMEQTEQQFARLLGRAVAPARLRLRLFSLPGVARGAAAQARMAASYEEIDALWADPPDAVAVTGAEPRAHDLRDEPYWPALARLLDWAQARGVPLILSCLAAHAAVLHLDGIRRTRLASKRFGVFSHAVTSGHPATQGVSAALAVPHSRWNEVHAKDLAARAYTVLTMSDDAGVDTFVRPGPSPMLFFQGHPEYAPGTLLSEYRRDAGRFLRGERETYPDLPLGYFEDAAAEALLRFRARALAERGAHLLEAFPVVPASARREHPRQEAAAVLVGNWLAHCAGLGHGRVRAAVG